jgi:hypothetical protein
MRLASFLRDNSGSMAIETAFAMPILASLALGGFEASRVIARNTEIQTAAAEASAIVLAKSPETADEREVIEEVIEASTGLPPAGVTLSVKYRCGVESEYVGDEVICLGDDAIDGDDVDDGGYASEEISTFIEINMVDSYTPVWVDFGIGQPQTYNVTRRVQIK